MRRLARRLLTLCSTVSLVLCVGVCVLWVRSYLKYDLIALDLGSRRIVLHSVCGALVLDLLQSWDGNASGPLVGTRYLDRSSPNGALLRAGAPHWASIALFLAMPITGAIRRRRGTAIVLDEPPPAALAVGQAVRVVVDAQQSPQQPGGRAETPRRAPLAGFAKGTFEMRDDFNEPLDEFTEYR